MLMLLRVSPSWRYGGQKVLCLIDFFLAFDLRLRFFSPGRQISLATKSAQARAALRAKGHDDASGPRLSQQAEHMDCRSPGVNGCENQRKDGGKA